MNTQQVAEKYGKEPELVDYWLREFGYEYMISALDRQKVIIMTTADGKAAKRSKTDIVNAISEKTGVLASLSKMTIADLLILETKIA